MTGKKVTPKGAESVKLETAAQYTIGNTVCLIDRVFKEKADMVSDIIIRLIKKDIENLR